MNLIMSFSPKGNIILILFMTFMCLLISIFTFETYGVKIVIFMILLLISSSFLFIRRKIELYEDYILIIQNSKKILKYNEIKFINIEMYRPMLSKIAMPAITFYKGKNSKCDAYIFFKPYIKKDLISVLEFVLEKNRDILINENLRVFIRT